MIPQRREQRRPLTLKEIVGLEGEPRKRILGAVLFIHGGNRLVYKPGIRKQLAKIAYVWVPPVFQTVLT